MSASFQTGQRGSGAAEGAGYFKYTYLFAPVSWKGEKPEGVDRVIYGETTILGTLTRTAVFGPDDLPNTRKIQQAYKLMPPPCPSLTEPG
jgi:hypothetical protein